MTTILNALAKTLCLKHSGVGTIINESKHKLEGTYIYFQGAPAYVSVIHGNEGFRLKTEHGQSINLTFDTKVGEDDIRLFDLESGIYMSQQGIPVEVTRRVKKGYKKSFSPEAYHIVCVDAERSDEFHRNFTWFELYRMKRQTIYKYKNHLFYGRQKLADIGPLGKLAVYKLFTREIDEAIRNEIVKV